MKQFGDVYPEQCNGQLTMFDRVLFKGHLSGLYPFQRLEPILYKQGILLKEYKEFALRSSQQLREHVKEMAHREVRCAPTTGHENGQR